MTLASPLFLDLTPARGWAPRAVRVPLLRRSTRSCAATSSPARYQPGEKLLVGPLVEEVRREHGRGSGGAVAARRHGLVVVEDQRGFRVSPLSLADLRDVTHTRIELECLALRRSIARGDAAWRADLERAWRDLDAAPGYEPGSDHRRHELWSRMHGRFHAALVSACGLDWLMKFRTILYEQSERYRRLSRTVMRGRARHAKRAPGNLRGDDAGRRRPRSGRALPLTSSARPR